MAGVGMVLWRVLTSRATGPVLAVASVVLLCFWAGDAIHVGRLRRQLQEVNTELAFSQNQVETLELSARRWRVEAESAANALDVAKDQARRVRQQTVTRIIEIEKAHVPTGCTEAVRWGAAMGAAFATDWNAQ